MSARAAIHAFVTVKNDDEEAELERRLDAYRAEVLREAEAKAEDIESRLFSSANTERAELRASGARAVAWELHLLAAGLNEPTTDTSTGTQD
jgi:hypothetical protein